MGAVVGRVAGGFCVVNSVDAVAVVVGWKKRAGCDVRAVVGWEKRAGRDVGAVVDCEKSAGCDVGAVVGWEKRAGRDVGAVAWARTGMAGSSDNRAAITDKRVNINTPTCLPTLSARWA
jgi:hypothetical protein